jgi:putative hydrolase of the HAD superfamily
VVEEVLPEAGRLLRRQRDRFIQREVQLLRRTDLNPGAAEVLREGIARRLHLGIVSNAQAYTLPELESALKPAGLGPDIFDPLLVFWSFQHGFSKPNPHAFRILQARLDELGIRPGEVLLVGDRFDNDIAPARAFGWRTWWLAPDCDPPAGGTWPALLEYLQTVPAPESPMPPGQDS